MILVLSSSLANEGNQIFIHPDGSQNKHRCANIRLILAQRQERDTGRADNMDAGAQSIVLYAVLISSILLSLPHKFIPFASNTLY